MSSNQRAMAENLAKRAYRIGVRQDETTAGQPVVLAWVVELEDCVGHGATEMDAVQDVRNAMVDYIESLLEDKLPVPVPLDELPVSFSAGSRLPAVSGKIQGVWQSDMPETIRPYLVARAGT